MATLASSNRVALRQAIESIFGTTPSTPTLKGVRMTGESLNFNIQNITSDELRADRQTTDLVQVSADASGDINFEMSYDAYDEFLSAVMASDWSTAISISATDISAANADSSFNSTVTDFTTENVNVGQWIKVSGFTETANNGYFRVTSVAANKLVVAGGTLADEAAGDTIAVAGSRVINGTTLKSFTIQKHFQDLDTPVFVNFTGMRIGSMSLNFQVGQILGGSFSLMGLSSSTDTSQIAGATTPDAPTNEVMNAVSGLVGIQIDDTASTAYFSNLTLDLNNNLRAQDAIGTLGHVGIALSRLELTGNVSIYFQDQTLYNKYLNGTSFSLSFRVQDNDGNAYIFTIPEVKFESGTVVAGGLDQDVMLETTWRSIMHPTLGYMMQIDKFAA